MLPLQLTETSLNWSTKMTKTIYMKLLLKYYYSNITKT